MKRVRARIAFVFASVLCMSMIAASVFAGGRSRSLRFPPAPALGSFSLFDNAQYVIGGIFPGISAVDLSSVQCNLVAPIPGCSDSNITDSGIAWTPPHRSQPTLSQITTLSADYNMDATDCGGGSPRFVIRLANGDFLTGYFGLPPNFTNCPVGWQNTGNFVDPSNTSKRWAVGNSGTYDTYSNVASGDMEQTVTEIDLIVDGGWKDTPRGQDVLIDDFTVNNDVQHIGPFER
jgi:hypothetical protein